MRLLECSVVDNKQARTSFGFGHTVHRKVVHVMAFSCSACIAALQCKHHEDGAHDHAQDDEEGQQQAGRGEGVVIFWVAVLF